MLKKGVTCRAQSVTIYLRVVYDSLLDLLLFFVGSNGLVQ